MKQELMDKMVDDALQHIPEGPISAGPQKALRMAFNAHWRSALSHDAATPAKESLRKAIELVQPNHPEWKPEFDQEYFG